MNGYDLSRKYFAYKFENPNKLKSNHTELYFYIIDLWNRLGQKENFGLPTAITMECLGIGSYNTYKKSLNDLIEFGFIKLVSDSKNQHQSKVIAISKNDKALDKALDKATIKALDKAPDYIDKQLNKENIYIENQNLTDTDKQLEAFNNVLNTNPEIKKDFEELPKSLNIDADYYKLFIEKWNEYVLKFTDRKTGISELTPFEKSQLKSINRPIKEISEGLFVLFSQNDKETLPQCWTRPTHFLKQEQFLKYFEDAQNFKITKKITQFHKSKN
jgi:hypothetical protein